jgi:hypothetical protein
MNLILPIDNVILTTDELIAISGREQKSGQVEWLASNGWTFAKTAAGMPIVGRWYAHMKMAGVDTSMLAGPAAKTMPDFSKAR